MKYIRMKDGIYEIDETTILTSLPPCYKVIKPTDKHYAINVQQVIKSADTIDKLCDEFVGVDVETKTGCIFQYSELDKVKEEMNKYDFEQGKDYEIYGAIWTDKGLIYVAKMNDKGELCLL